MVHVDVDEAFHKSLILTQRTFKAWMEFVIIGVCCFSEICLYAVIPE